MRRRMFLFGGSGLGVALALASLGEPLLIPVALLLLAIVMADALLQIWRLWTHARDHFRRRDQTGSWGRASVLRKWKVMATSSGTNNIAIIANRGVISYAGHANNKHVSQWVVLDHYLIGDCDARARFVLSPVNVKTGTAGIFVHRQPNHDHYLARYDGDGNIQIMVKTGTQWEYVACVPFAMQPGRAYWIRMAVHGQDIFVWTWPDGKPEPRDCIWQGRPKTTYPRGGIGLYGYGVKGSLGVQFDTFIVRRSPKNLNLPQEP